MPLTALARVGRRRYDGGMPMPNSDYETLELFVQTVLKRLAEEKTDLISANEDLMYPLTAWDKGVAQEFVPWMKLRMAEWANDDA